MEEKSSLKTRSRAGEAEVRRRIHFHAFQLRCWSVLGLVPRFLRFTFYALQKSTKSVVYLITLMQCIIINPFSLVPLARIRLVIALLHHRTSTYSLVYTHFRGSITFDALVLYNVE